MWSLPLIQKYIGTHHNIIGFDPRGVNGSGPDTSCFPGQIKTSYLYGDEFRKPVDVNNSASIGEAFARAGAVGDWCTRVHSEKNSTSRYANTIATATDMLAFIEAQAVARNQKKEDAKLSYLGISYGTVLGSTYAALFPNRIHRMILDAVVDADNYYQGKWTNNLPDADAAIKTFFRDCHAGGKENCPLWDETPEAIERRFHTVLDKLAAVPMSVSASRAVRAPDIVTVGDLKMFISQAAYVPAILFPRLAQIMKELENGNATSLAQFAISRPDLDSCDQYRRHTTAVEPRYYIACNDGNNRFNVSNIADYTALVRDQQQQSKYMGEWWATGTGIMCRQLRVNPPESQIFPATFPHVNETSHPILFVGNTADPVTPLRHAQKMQKLFGGAGLLTQNSAGHSMTAAASLCTERLVSEYVESGKLPAEGTVCEAEEIPFKEFNGTSTHTEARMILRKRSHLGM